jgi:uncharacterized glyoxalase superfamily protein PhnB
VIVRSLREDDVSWKTATLMDGWGSTTVARLGELLDASPLRGFVAVDGDARVGLLLYAERDDGIEVVTLQSMVPRRGVGRALMHAVYDRGVQREAARIWLITTNDNLRAMSFYWQWGMTLVRFVRDGADRSRLVKPSIPAVARNGIPIRHELEFERVVRSAARDPALSEIDRLGDDRGMATTINPVVHYRNLDAGARFLVETFGFEQHAAHKDEQGVTQYVELSLDGAPLGLGEHSEGSIFDTGPAVVYISLDEVDGMHQRALAAGAEILMDPTDQDYGSRDFVARDHEGNVWCFGTYQPGA